MADENKPQAPPPGPPPGPPKPAAGEGGKPAAPAKAAAGPPLPPDPPPPAGVEQPAFIQSLLAKFPEGLQLSFWVGDWTVIVTPDRLLELARFLHDTPDAPFDFCSDVTAIDWPARPEQRFDVVYCLYSTTTRQRVRIKTRTSDANPVPSVTAIWPSANWLEREVYDMFGIRFAGHPDLRRILMPEDWQGHPERKDYPLQGPGELILEDPQEWLRLRQAAEESEIE